LVEHLSDRQAVATVLSGRLAEILDAVDAGVTVIDAELRVVYVNQAAASLCGWSTPEEMLAASADETLARFELLDESGGPVSPAVLPGRRVLAGEDPDPMVLRFRVKATGEERWSIVRARAIGANSGRRLAITTFNDLTAQVQEGQAQQASERRYREIVEALPVFAWFADPDGAMVAANARWLEYTGAMAESGTLENVEQVHEAERSDLAARWRGAHDAVEPLEATVRLRRHDGEFRWHILRVVPLRGEAGTLQGWIGTATDIDDERRASLALLEAERQFRDLTDSAPMLVWMAGLDRDHTFFNRGWLEFTGQSLEDQIGSGWIDAVHPDDIDRRRSTLEKAYARQDRFEIEYRLRRRDGIYRWVLDIGAPRRGLDGEFLGFVGSCVDIEERKRASDIARLVADAGLRLDETRDLDETIQAAASLAIPDLADFCIVDLVEPDGSLRRVAAVAKDAEHQAILDKIRDFPTDPASARPAARAVGERRPILLTDIHDPEVLRRNTAGNEALAAIILAMEARSAIVQPLIARGETIGAMFFVVGPGRDYGPAEIEITTELSRRVALAISNGQVHAAEQVARRSAEASAERVARLQRVTRGLGAAMTRDAVASLVVREGRAALDASGALVALSQDDALYVVASDGYDEGVVASYAGTSMASNNPLARAARESVPMWLPDIRAAEADDDRTRTAFEQSANRSLCAVPLIADGITFGVIGLSFAESRPFDEDDRALIGAYADLCAQALARVALTNIRERLVTDLESQRARLETLLQQLPEGLMIAEAPSGRMILANERLEEILRIPASEIHHIAGGEAYQGFDADGRQLLPEDWPLARAVRGETVPYTEIELVRADGTRTWVAKRAGPVFDREGRVVAGVATIIDIGDARRARENRQFLANATELLGSSLDYEETIRRVAELSVPRIGDWCAVDVIDETGIPRRIAVAHPDPEMISFAREVQERYPADPDSPRGLPFVLRTGQSDMMSDVPTELVEAAARDADHLKLLRALRLQSYMCVPIIAAGQVLGAMTFVGAESGRHYTPDDLAFAEALAARAASAISNARSFREALRYKRVLDATLDTVVMFDPVTLRLSYANRGAIDQLGYSEEELLATDATTLIEDLDAIGIRGLVSPLVSGTLDAHTTTLSFRHRDGHSIPVEVLLQHVAPPGEDGRIVAVARDIADRIEAQANLRRVAEAEHARAAELNAVIRAMGDGIFVCTGDGQIRLSNPAAEDVFPDVNETTYGQILDQLDDPEGTAPALGTTGGPIELRARGSDERWIEVSTYPVARGDGEEGDQDETIVMLRDVTASRHAQAIRDTFIGVLSHELRTPVTTIFAGSKVLARDDDQLPPETRKEIFSDIVVESERLHRLVEDVIAMTRFGEDEGEVGTEPVLIQRVLPVVIRSEELRWPGVTFVVDLPPGVPTVVADPTYVEQVVRNLLSNAAKYGGIGTTVRISVEAGVEEIIVTIADDGPGFPEEEAERLFELFFRSARTSTSAAGAGIGLFVCARLIKAMGGRIWAVPRPGGGADFSFSLRIMDEEP
jgi:PAS domain S-box-containing protein